MKRILVRMAVLILTILLTVGMVSAAEAEGAQARSAAVQEEGQERAGRAVFTVLGASFLCAGGMVALIMARDRR